MIIAALHAKKGFGLQSCLSRPCSLLQLGFFSIVGIPLFKAITDLFKDAQPMMDGLLANYHMWEAAAKAQGPQP